MVACLEYSIGLLFKKAMMNKIASPLELQTELRRLLASSQEANPSREKMAGELRVLAGKLASVRVSSSGQDILNLLLGGEDKVGDAYDRLEEDEQSRQLFSKVVRQLQQELKLSQGAEEALGRVIGIVGRGKTWDMALIRNNVFKAAHSLGIPLPSGMF